jgi:hypothetical protein
MLVEMLRSRQIWLIRSDFTFSVYQSSVTVAFSIIREVNKWERHFGRWAAWSSFLNLQKFQISKIFKKPGCRQLHALRLYKFLIWNTLYCILGKYNKKPYLGAWIVPIFSSKNRQICIFLLSLHNKVFHNEKLHDRSIYSWLHPGIFLNFFENLKFKLFSI